MTIVVCDFGVIILCNASWTCCSDCVSSDEEASSRSKMAWFFKIARAIAVNHYLMSDAIQCDMSKSSIQVGTHRSFVSVRLILAELRPRRQQCRIFAEIDR